MKSAASTKLYNLYKIVSPGGVQSNVRFEEPNPKYFRHASGSRIWDIDGNEYLDCHVGNGTIILGHNHKAVTQSVLAVLETGLTSGYESELSYDVVDCLCRLIPSTEMARLTTSGTEAVLRALMIAKGFTGRKKIVKAEGSYHGWYGDVAVSYRPSLDEAGPPDSPCAVPMSQGLDSRPVKQSIVIPYNDITNSSKIINLFKNEIAAVIVEPASFSMGGVLPRNDYLKGLREITTKNDILLIFDEIITGFRLSPGGAQEYYGVKPDLSIFGKAMGNGFPISALAGRADILAVSRPGGPVSYGGMYNGNQVSLAAAQSTMNILKTGDVQKHLHRCTESLITAVERISEENKILARLQGVGGQFQIYFTESEIRNYREAARVDGRTYERFRKLLNELGVLFTPNALSHHGVSMAHGLEDIQLIIRCFDEVFATLRTTSADRGLPAVPEL